MVKHFLCCWLFQFSARIIKGRVFSYRLYAQVDWQMRVLANCREGMLTSEARASPARNCHPGSWFAHSETTTGGWHCVTLNMEPQLIPPLPGTSLGFSSPCLVWWHFTCIRKITCDECHRRAVLVQMVQSQEASKSRKDLHPFLHSHLWAYLQAGIILPLFQDGDIKPLIEMSAMKEPHNRRLAGALTGVEFFICAYCCTF